MRRFFGLSLLFVVLAGTLSAREAERFALGFGIEGNSNTRDGMAMGESLYFSYEIIKNLEAGVTFGVNHNFQNMTVLEPAAMGRWYFFELPKNKFFAQADLGASLILEDGTLTPLFLGGLTLGARFPLGPWYLEPYARGGYPFIWGAGLKAGYRF
jgi:hypothetical protein